jgi:hypothetical protein
MGLELGGVRHDRRAIAGGRNRQTQPPSYPPTHRLHAEARNDEPDADLDLDFDLGAGAGDGTDAGVADVLEDIEGVVDLIEDA